MPIHAFDHTMGLLARFLDGSAAKHHAIASNLANQDTPGYRAVDVSFQSALTDASGAALAPLATQPGHVAAAPTAFAGITTTADAHTTRLDGNTVSVEHEMAKLAENTLLYQTGAELLSAKFRLLKTAIREGR
ncbi:MAG: flagellar basal body rod protein FlgB [Nitrospirota bacterium]